MKGYHSPQYWLHLKVDSNIKLEELDEFLRDIWDGEGWLCESCAKNHECDEDMFLPVLNSPRTGVCGYTGSY